MSELPFDVHDHRHHLKQLEDRGEKSLWRNETDLECPICDEPFVYLLAMERPTTFATEKPSRTCISHQPDASAVVTFLHG